MIRQTHPQVIALLAFAIALVGFAGTYSLSIALSRPTISAVKPPVSAAVGIPTVEVEMTGLVSWVNSTSIRIVDSHGRVHEIAIMPSTQIVDASTRSLARLDIVHTQSYVSIDAIQNADGIHATQVTVR